VDFCVRAKVDGLKDWDMEEDDGFGFWIGGVLEEEDVAVVSKAANDGGTWRGINGVTL
jgi:hypothetical protein